MSRIKFLMNFSVIIYHFFVIFCIIFIVAYFPVTFTGMKKYLSLLQDHSLVHTSQLTLFSSVDWKRLDLPSVIEDALKTELRTVTGISSSVTSGIE